jgi:hypothetical protein
MKRLAVINDLLIVVTDNTAAVLYTYYVAVQSDFIYIAELRARI